MLHAVTGYRAVCHFCDVLFGHPYLQWPNIFQMLAGTSYMTARLFHMNWNQYTN